MSRIRYYLKIKDGPEIFYIEMGARTLPKAQIEAERHNNLGEIGIKNRSKEIKVISRKNAAGEWELVFS